MSNNYSLYNYWRSSSSWRVRIVLAHKQLAFDYKAIHLVQDGGAQHDKSFRKMNPMRQVPVLSLLDNAGKTVFLGQSVALMEFLEEVHPSPSMLPGSPINRAKIRQLTEIINAGTQPLQNLAVIQHIRDELGLDHVSFCRKWIRNGLQAFQTTAKQTAGTYCYGDTVTFADACLIPQLYNARRFSMDLDPFSFLTDIEARCAQLPAFIKAHPEQQPDAAM